MANEEHRVLGLRDRTIRRGDVAFEADLRVLNDEHR